MVGVREPTGETVDGTSAVAADPRADPRGASPDPASDGAVLRCRWCGRRFTRTPGPGRPRQFCRQGCRQQAHLARKLADAYGLGPGDVIVDRQALEELQGALYCLQAAIEDVDRDLAAARTKGDLEDALRWLLDNARPLAEVWIEPRTSDG